MSTGNIVKLDVGGTIFKTSKSTLTKFDGFFKTMLETEIPITKDESGAIFIDRDPTHFHKILNYMRDGEIELPKNSEDVKDLQKEAQYYLLDGLVELCESINNQNSKVSTEDIVKLDVGGTIFKVSKSTLTRYSFFNTMLETNIPITEDAIFINRDPTHFHRILNYMRDRRLEFPESLCEVLEIRNEAKHYRLYDLFDSCDAEIFNRLKDSIRGTQADFKSSLRDFNTRYDMDLC